MLTEILSKAKHYKNLANTRKSAHYDLARSAQKNGRIMGIIVTVLSSIVGTAIFATLTKENTADWVRIGTGLLSVTAAVFSALHTFLGFSENAERNRKAAFAYEAVCCTIDNFILLYAPLIDTIEEHKRTTALDSLHKIAIDIEKASESAPTIPNSVYDKCKKNKVYS